MQPPLPPVPAHVVRVPFRFHAAPYTAVLDARRNPPLYILSGSHIIESPARREWKPWKLEVGDVDGDGRPDLLLGVTKRTHQLRFPHTCLFIYTFDGKSIRRKWLGSTMGRPLIDFELAPADRFGWQPVFTLEALLDGKFALSRYRWRGFGLHRNSGQQICPNAGHLHSVNGMLNLDAEGRIIPIDPKTWH